MSNAQDSGPFLSALVRRWPVVVGAVIAGALIAGAFALTDPVEPTWEASTTLRYTPPSGVGGAPTADTFVAMATSPSLQRSVAESLGVDPSEIIGSVEAAISPRDRTMIVIRVEAPSSENAVERADAMADAAITESLEPVRRHTEYWEGVRLSEAERKLDAALERSEELRRQMGQVPSESVELRVLENELYANELRIMDTRAAIEYDRFLLEGMYAAITVVEDTAVQPKRTLVYDLTGVVRGALVGAFAGALVAAVLAKRDASA